MDRDGRRGIATASRSARSGGGTRPWYRFSVVVGAGCGGVHADQVKVGLSTGRGLGDHGLRQLLEDACGRPGSEAVVDGRPRPVLLRQIPPRAASTKPPHHRVELPPQVRDRTALTQGQVRIDQGPFLVGEVSARLRDGLPGRQTTTQAHPSDLNPVQALVEGDAVEGAGQGRSGGERRPVGLRRAVASAAAKMAAGIRHPSTRPGRATTQGSRWTRRSAHP